MNKVAVLLGLVCLTATIGESLAQTKTRQCRGSRQLSPDEVSLSNCQSGVCKLKRKTDAVITLKVVPDREIKQLTTHVQAFINNFPFPFIGVDGQSACNNLFNETGQKESCPLQKGKTYIYRNSFKVLEVYPKIQLVVHWALQYDNKDVVCFEVPARIV